MPATKERFETPEQYIASFPKDVQKVLKEVQATIKKAVPGAEEMISYQIPAFKLNDSWIFYYSAYTHHFSLSCPPPTAIYEKFKKELAGNKQSKSAIQFPLNEPVPAKLISDMAKFRAKENQEKPKKPVKAKSKK